MSGREPGKPDGKKVFADAERPIGKRFGNSICRRARAGFGAVRGEGDASGEKRGKPPPLSSEPEGNVKSENRCRNRTDEGVDEVPHGVEVRNFVGKEFENVETNGEAENNGVREDVEFFRKMDHVEAFEKAECGNGGVEIEP